MEVEDRLWVKRRLGWQLLSSSKKLHKSWFCGHIMKVSSIYLLKRIGLLACVLINLLIKADVKIFAIVGGNAAPIAVPCVLLEYKMCKFEKIVVDVKV